MNNVSLIGRITKDIELRSTESGIQVVRTSIAINNGKNEKGEDRPADFPTIYVYEKQAENLNKFCKKGSLIAVTGRLKTRSWDKEDGSKAYETYVRANTIQFLDSKPKEGVPMPEPEYATSNEEPADIPQNYKSQYDDLGSDVKLEDNDLPF